MPTIYNIEVLFIQACPIRLKDPLKEPWCSRYDWVEDPSIVLKYTIFPYFFIAYQQYDRMTTQIEELRLLTEEFFARMFE